MADSNLTKRAFARAMKALMSEKPFEKISVGDICERCDMNRKSFYYHFRDKYDLVNWIFDTEFVPLGVYPKICVKNNEAVQNANQLRESGQRSHPMSA